MRLRPALAALLLPVALLAGCGDDGDDGDDAAPDGTEETTEATDAADGSDPSEETTASSAVAEDPVLSIVVTNDDGYDAAGIDAVVEALVAEGHEVEVVAPLEQQSGTGGTYTEGAVESQEVQTASGHDALAVDGFPSDSVRVALDELELTPDLVVSGINEGQNVGGLVDVSGTIGAARAAVARGVPALALSAALGPVENGYEVGAELMVGWIDENAEALLAGEAPVEVTSINIPSCPDGQEVEDLVEVPVATEGEFLAASDCASELTDPADDTEALNNGFPTLTVVPAEPATPPQPG
ncbi:5'/3'-nucleotidase SurE [Iamia sp. SCSIO 61187]|uniref:5'/3'-nucleotidase SurE n=1 Tax=Iamia sp. SCSIO 61187 TaxID=2722752 RepID=UPI001C637408|nr:5'/3'-nucleotidase SurE [Iamia sp. SCSIO 61187]QYG92427.1 5'/3'-nucleotidase SurE [Iamia sp. SCSIO 61187]